MSCYYTLLIRNENVNYGTSYGAPLAKGVLTGDGRVVW